MSDPICPCGRTIVKDQFCAETPDQFAKRYNSQRCRAKCARLYPVRASRPLPSLSPVSWNHERGEGVAQPKEVTPRDSAYLDFVRTFDCVECNWPSHLKKIDAHHLETGGTSIKCSDYLTVPLCAADARGCHAAADKSPESAEKYRPYALMLQTLWVKAGHHLKK